MKRQRMFVALLVFAAGMRCLAQPGDPDSKTLLAILTEIRGIHEDLRATESTQILLTELQMEQGVVNRALERLDEARSKLLQVQMDEKGVSGELKRSQDALNQATDPQEQKHFSDEVERDKSNLALLKTDEQARAATVQDAQDRLRNAQETLDATQSELNEMVKRLNPGQK